MSVKALARHIKTAPRYQKELAQVGLCIRTVGMDIGCRYILMLRILNTVYYYCKCTRVHVQYVITLICIF